MILSCAALASGQDDFAKAREIVDAVAAGMRDAAAIAFESEVRTRIETMGVSHRVKALLQRPDLARLEMSGAGQNGLMILDGATSWHYIKARNGFVKSTQLGTMKLEQYGVGPAAILFFEKGAGTLLPYLSDAAVTKESLGKDECSVVTWKVGTEEMRLWISGNRLRRFGSTRSVDGRTFEQTFTYGPFDLSPTVAGDAFVFVPPPGAALLSGGDESRCLAIGTDAPDVGASHLDGAAMRLSDLRGKPVLLSFWFYGCATCRQELPRLQKLNAAYAARGLVTVAVNHGDEPETIRAYFEKEKFTFTPVVQRKGELSDAFGVRSYPTSYLIGPDGKVVWRMAGFDEISLRTALDKLLPPESRASEGGGR
jgi:peroxiredoxin/outer membrane lipoprotein-sorting protein